jgi:hypothetical protein
MKILNGCGRKQTIGHGEYIVCGEGYPTYKCWRCKRKEEALEGDNQ